MIRMMRVTFVLSLIFRSMAYGADRLLGSDFIRYYPGGFFHVSPLIFRDGFKESHFDYSPDFRRFFYRHNKQIAWRSHSQTRDNFYIALRYVVDVERTALRCSLPGESFAESILHMRSFTNGECITCT